MHRVVVTGLGPVSGIGIGVNEFTAGLRSGRSAAAPITSFDASGFPHHWAGEVPAFRPEALLRRLRVADWGRSALFAAAAARLAAMDAGLSLPATDPARVGAVVGTTSGESTVVEQLTAELVAGGYPAMSAEALRQAPAERLSYAVSAELGLAGESVTLTTACSASNYAIGYAYDLLCWGEADVMVAGGADSVCRWAHAGFYRLGALTERACRPFDRDRSGILTGEGGAALVLETLKHAQDRGARIYAEVLGYGVNCDAHHMVAPNEESVAACMRLAQENAGVKPEDIDYISTHGTGTPANDLCEARAIRAVFGDRVPPVSSIKSMLGHTMGAASGFGAIATTLGIRHGFLPPTINWANPDPELSWIDPVPNTARPATVRVAQNNGFAFGGNNAITIFGAIR
ncbi:beta-ketoacyl-[acyl-carrier-protein] synthase family protein [Micromonospora lupini]|uniref:beta-ketoacyl-[acyl-carrier-protein] synthase family protein n=1 Tax=Micromonospora lupini TaxID=285679 RepID=UPI002258E313|nr:beta-ketoacyl-[acyl-carrier-protein] synthase family protein [Micromonospora lupini]MCX5064970.1 beta-ketoacyl-[acyl-carrier-protein] synthase family protein [Micromonospora lupini]